MQHGRDHDERLQKAERPRNQNLPIDDDETDLEARMEMSGRGNVRPAMGLVGAHFRGLSPARMDMSGSEEPTGNSIESGGSDYAPTAQATRRERERHRLERERGRVAAGTGGFARDSRPASLSPDDLREAAREADRRVVGHEVGDRSTH